jgi:hypothetical protein
MCIPRNSLKMMIYISRVLANEIFRKVIDRLENQSVVRPKPRFTRANNTVVRVDANKQAPVDKKRNDTFDLQLHISKVSQTPEFCCSTSLVYQPDMPINRLLIRVYRAALDLVDGHRPAYQLRFEERVHHGHCAFCRRAIDFGLGAAGYAITKLVILERNDLSIDFGECEIVGPDALTSE